MSLAAALHDQLLAHGPCTEHQLHAAMVDLGITRTKTSSTVRTALRASVFATQLPDQRWDTTTRRLTGAVLTVRPRSVLRDETLWVHRDLEPLDALYRLGGFPLAAGGAARRGASSVSTLIGPPGWLPAVEPGELLGLRWNGMFLEVVPVASTASPARLAQVRSLLRLHGDLPAATYGRPTPDLARLVLSALQEDPGLLSDPLPPLSELLPLPEGIVDDPSLWEAHGGAHRVTLHVPSRVYGELSRRSTVLGDRLTDYAAMLLGAAVDRVAPPSRYTDSEPWQEPWREPAYYPDDDEESVVMPFRPRS